MYDSVFKEMLGVILGHEANNISLKLALRPYILEKLCFQSSNIYSGTGSRPPDLASVQHGQQAAYPIPPFSRPKKK